jgi:HSP20 family protein
MTQMRVYNKNGQDNGVIAPFYRYSDMFNDFFGEGKYSGNCSNPAVNIIEDKESFMLYIALPGVSKADVNIEVEKNILSLSRTTETQDAELNYNRREFDYSNFERTFRLPQSVDVSKISAKMENGILNLNLPKKEEAIDKGPKEIKIS